MRTNRILIASILLLPTLSLALTISCSGMPGGGSCGSCTGFTLAQTNSPADSFSPRSTLTSGQSEVIDLSQSSITATTYQGATVTPTGDITSSYNLVSTGPNTGWTWATLKPGNAIVRGNIPSGIDFNQPVYSIKYTIRSSVSTSGTLSDPTTITECGYFFATAPTTVPPVCGNSSVESGEQCDDGNSNNNDFCSNSCRNPQCGNSIREGSEQCDDGNNNDSDSCSNICRTRSTAFCGNGILEGSEQCDDGNPSNTDTCSTQCRTLILPPSSCRSQVMSSEGPAPLSTSLLCTGNPMGRPVIIITRNNRVVDQFETTNTNYTFRDAGRYTVRCYPDGAGDQANNCRTTVDVTGICGNGRVESGEQCDDGNTISGDSCDRSCRTNDALCGNGTIDRGEQCDDGNNDNFDSCSSICHNEFTESGPADTLLIILIASLAGALIFFGARKWMKS